jgi:hypothetical protein
MKDAFAIFVALVAIPASAGGASRCLPGEKIHWIADYCMASLETDDEIAASECISRHLKRKFAGDCAAKKHFKSRMCQLARQRGQRHDSVAACVADTRFVGSTVRNGGVGGQAQ